MNYIYNVLLNIKGLTSWGSFLIGMAFTACFVIWYTAKFNLVKSPEDDESQEIAKFLFPFVKMLGVIFAVCLVLYILIPDTYYLKDIIRGR